jgi:hypothetical protein
LPLSLRTEPATYTDAVFRFKAKPLPICLLIAFAGASSASFAGNAASHSMDAAERVESLAKSTRVSEERILDEIMGRMGRIESTTADIRSLIEAMPDAQAAPLTATAAPTSTPAPANAAIATVAATCVAPVMASADEALSDDDNATAFPVEIVAGGSALAALLLGLLLGRRRSTAAVAGQAPVDGLSKPSQSAKETSANKTASEPVWQPRNRIAPDHKTTAGAASAAAQAASAALTGSAASLAAARAITLAQAKAAPAGSTQTSDGLDIDSRAFDPTLELAEIMMSMGLAGGAAQALDEYIRSNPRAALEHWLKLLDIYRLDGHRSDFEKTARELRQNFNIRAGDWLKSGAKQPSLEDFPRVRDQVVALWASPSECVSYLTDLLEDNREGMRVGFPQSAAEDILLLIALQKAQHPALFVAATTEQVSA